MRFVGLRQTWRGVGEMVEARRNAGRDGRFPEEFAAGLDTPRPRMTGRRPLLNLLESPTEYLVVVELPGISREEVLLDVTAEGLTVAGNRNLPLGGAEDGFRREERWRGEWHRRLYFPHKIDADRVTAQMADGLLRIWLPKIPAAKARRVRIEAPKSDWPEASGPMTDSRDGKGE